MKKLDIKGIVVGDDDKPVYDWLKIRAVCPDDVCRGLVAANGEAVEVYLNSPGGDVFAGAEIYAALKDYKGEVTIKIVGCAASIASVIAMAGRCLISPVGQIMIHNVSASSQGDYRDMTHMADVLKGWNETIVNAYLLKSGMSKNELLELMDNETWITPQKALDLRLADGILFDEVGQLQLSAALPGNILPGETVNKIKNLINNPLSNKDEADFLLCKARLELLKLGGRKNG